MRPDRSNIFLYVSILLAASLTVHATSWEVGNDGRLCIMQFRKKLPRYVPYMETYRTRKWGLFHQMENRLNYRIEYSPVWQEARVCCDGYEMRDNECEPKCSHGCVNGWCVSPERCRCDPLHVPLTYSPHGNVCVPSCRGGCPNGSCASPNRCDCDPGYRSSLTGSECEPICSQDCEQLNARCVEPDRCECMPGYLSTSNDSSASDAALLCAPICEVTCTNGRCVAPDTCRCDHGYEPGADRFSCVAKCEPACRFGHCASPNVCVCDPGYRPNAGNVCEPICTESCVHGACIAPDVCSCEPGYGLLGDSVHVCEPVCEKACVNGTCTAPGVCRCYDGYQFHGAEEDERICEPVCQIPCYPYGECVAPDTCSCVDGYRPAGTSEKVKEMDRNGTEYRAPVSGCVPICEQSCVNGRCVEPNVCECEHGYRPSETGTGSDVCEPVCETACGPNSVCTGPNACACLPGYRPLENDVAQACEPICEPDCAPNGTCTAPNVCTCNRGYERDAHLGNRCAPSCPTCRNGTCVAPDVCRCSEGYVPINRTTCAPFCEKGCRNGDCVAPGRCRCHDGFSASRNDAHSCVEACTRVCTGHGVCVEEGKACDCSYGWTGWDCEQPTVCILLLDPGDESLVGVTVHNETNSTLMDARRYAPYCYQCNETVADKSYCFSMVSGDGSPMVGCFAESGTPCYTMYRGTAAAVSMMTGALVLVTILIMAAATIAAYLLSRRHRRRRTRAAVLQSSLIRGTLDTDTLLAEEEPTRHRGIVHESPELEDGLK